MDDYKYYETVAFGICYTQRYITEGELEIGSIENSYPYQTPSMNFFCLPCMIGTDNQNESFVSQPAFLYIRFDKTVWLSIPPNLKSDIFNMVFVNTVFYGYYDR